MARDPGRATEGQGSGGPRPLRLRDWLVAQIESGRYAGLRWEDAAKTVFRIPWKHAAKQDYRAQQDAALFRAWAIYKGKHQEGIDKEDPPAWKTRLRCALNKSTDFLEVRESSQLDCAEPYKVYRIVSDGAPRPDPQDFAPLEKKGHFRSQQAPPGEVTTGLGRGTEKEPDTPKSCSTPATPEGQPGDVRAHSLTLPPSGPPRPSPPAPRMAVKQPPRRTRSRTPDGPRGAPCHRLPWPRILWLTTGTRRRTSLSPGHPHPGRTLATLTAGCACSCSTARSWCGQPRCARPRAATCAPGPPWDLPSTCWGGPGTWRSFASQSPRPAPSCCGACCHTWSAACCCGCCPRGSSPSACARAACTGAARSPRTARGPTSWSESAPASCWTHAASSRNCVPTCWKVARSLNTRSDCALGRSIRGPQASLRSG
ncbi:interferon regulatory factor 7 isoform X2 [Sorex araneus]|uniref:interferon regulatory factor 7 isoform X2 n=1 Tax=Sorex araneus TaxID=42254 RepID=UPI00243350ED|nr:interferon regulatory factor 7 isoform X2 [Sorex araneus]